MKNDNQRYNMVKTLCEREEFLVIGLTGRVGSGCSEAADIFHSTIQELQLPSIYPGDRGLQDDDERDRRILVRYFNAHWQAFDIIQVRTIITTFLLDNLEGFIKELQVVKGPVQSGGLNDEKAVCKDTEEALRNGILQRLKEARDAALHKNAFQLLRSMEPGSGDPTGAKASDGKTGCENPPATADSKPLDRSQIWKKEVDEICKLADEILSDNPDKPNDPDIPDEKTFSERVDEAFKQLYRVVLPGVPYEKRRLYCETVDQALYAFSAIASYKWFESQPPDKVWSKLQEINQKMEGAKTQALDFKCFLFVHDIMPAMAAVIHSRLASPASSQFTELFQKYGNCIRRFGKIVYDRETVNSCLEKPQEADTFAIPRKINQFIKVLRHPFARDFDRPARVAIDSLKNIFEATYLRERYSAFYLFAISANEPIRIKRLMESPKKRMNLEQIHYIDWNEYSSVGKSIYEKWKKDQTACSEEEAQFARRISAADPPDAASPLSDPIRKNAYEEDIYQFILQDVESCIQGADVFISNTGVEGRENQALKWEIVRNVCLILYPGLVLPTPVERCMQIAFAAKANSGCLSRQVGAVVTDAHYKILSIGWNDVPCGDISCSRKNLIDLCRLEDSAAYTHYELENREFRGRLKKYRVNSAQISKCLCGLPMRYCFKDIHADVKNPMRSRAMHGEEKALATCGRECEGGFLFTTASPCEMCSKNAKDHKIKYIYYVEPYPGISEDQYSRSGDPENIARHLLFTGAIGRAYTQMYTPIMPHKDVLHLLGVEDALCAQGIAPGQQTAKADEKQAK